MAEYQCCSCAATNQRCLKETCPCALSGEPCFERCESLYLRADCLNQKRIQCGCLMPSKLSTIKEKTPVCSTARCACYRYQESCTDSCACQKACKNDAPLDGPTRVELPGMVGCKCSSGKKACSKYTKCACKALLNFCGPMCKCGCACNNNSSAPLSPHIRSIFNKPDQELMALVAKLSGPSDYRYRIAIAMDEKEKYIFHPEVDLCDNLLHALSRYHIDISDVTIYMTKSPCFHQDCEPKCEIMDTCVPQRACAVRLCTLFDQVKRLTRNSDVSMSIRFLSPYVKRGDLYTKQAIQALIESGISVEPMTLKKWGSLLQENQENRESVSAQISFWAAANMDEHILHTQTYINHARRMLGIAEGLWISSFHDALKNAILTCGITQHRLNKLATQINQSAWETQSVIDIETHSSGTLASSVRSKHQLRKAKSFHNERPKVSKTEIYVKKADTAPGSSDSLDKKATNGPVSNQNGQETMENRGVNQAKILERMILNFATKSLTPLECAEIQAALSTTVEKLQGELKNLIIFLDQKTSTEEDNPKSPEKVTNGSVVYDMENLASVARMPETDL